MLAFILLSGRFYRICVIVLVFNNMPKCYSIYFIPKNLDFVIFQGDGE